MKHYQSGSEKRRKAAEAKERVSKLPKLTQFFPLPSAASQSSSTSNRGQGTSLSDTNNSKVVESPECQMESPTRVEVEVRPCEAVNRNESLLQSINSETKNACKKPLVQSDKSKPGLIHSSTEQNKPVRGFDLGLLSIYQFDMPHRKIEEAVRIGAPSQPKIFPKDNNNIKFPLSVLVRKAANGEESPRDYLTWSETQQALFCFPCRLFGHQHRVPKSHLSSAAGWSVANGPTWKKLHDRLPEHERSDHHRRCYISWRELEARLANDHTVDVLLQTEILSNRARWQSILKRILHVVFFLSERGLPFRGDSCLVNAKNNGLFLGVLELIASYDNILNAHLQKVKMSQESGKREQVHYLSPESQNEFIFECSEKLRGVILDQIKEAKYYTLILDSTPDTSCVEQTSIVLRYVHCSCESSDTPTFSVEERFLTFLDFSKKTGAAIASKAIEQLTQWNVPFANCRGQGYDNGSNMAGVHNGVQAILLRENKLALFSPCACHSLNLCGTNAAECCPEVVTYFGMVQKLFTFMSASPQRWEILRECLGCSLHGLSGTRWSERVDAVRPIAANISGVLKALDQVGDLTLFPEARIDLQGMRKYFATFECVIMTAIWIKVLTAIDQRNKMLQARCCTLDMEVMHLESLMKELNHFRNHWEPIYKESVLVAHNYGIEPHFSEKRTSKRRLLPGETTADQAYMPTDRETHFRLNVFYRLIDHVISSLTVRFNAARKIDSLFCFLYKYQTMTEDELINSTSRFQQEYAEDVSSDLTEEMLLLKKTSSVTLGSDMCLSPLVLIEKLSKMHLSTIFENVCVALRIFCTLPVTVAGAERSFSKLKEIKTAARSTMIQERLQGLALLCIESELAKTLNYDSIINAFAGRKERKAPL